MGCIIMCHSAANPILTLCIFQSLSPPFCVLAVRQWLACVCVNTSKVLWADKSPERASVRPSTCEDIHQALEVSLGVVRVHANLRTLTDDPGERFLSVASALAVNNYKRLSLPPPYSLL